MPNKTMTLTAENLCFSYAGKPFIHNASFEISAGEAVSIVGENGSGKSTLIRLLNGSSKPNQGKVLLNGINILSMPLKERAKHFTTIYQQTNFRFPFSCFQIVAMGLYPHTSSINTFSDKDIDFIEKIMEVTETLPFINRPVTELSGGEMQKVLLARALAQKPSLMFLDEATSALDIAARIRISELLYSLAKKQNIIVISVQHDLYTAFSHSNKIIAMKNGIIPAFGKPEDVISQDFFKEIFGVNAEIYNHKKFYIKGLREDYNEK